MTAASGWDCHVHVFDAAARALPGHYSPRTAALADAEQLGHEHGIGHLVLVQPSVYGSDNTVLLRALEGSQGRHRGVAVVDASARDAELDRLQAAGVRGVRFNLVSPVGNGGDALRALAPRLRARGWHAQWYVPASELAWLAGLQLDTGLPFVLDHLGGICAGDLDEGHWTALAELAAGGAWLKLSGWYRLRAREPYDTLVPQVERAARLFGTRLVWGSDWPHTSLPAAAPRHATLLAPVRAALGEDGLRQVLHHNPPRLYF